MAYSMRHTSVHEQEKCHGLEYIYMHSVQQNTLSYVEEDLACVPNFESLWTSDFFWSVNPKFFRGPPKFDIYTV